MSSSNEEENQELTKIEKAQKGWEKVKEIHNQINEKFEEPRETQKTIATIEQNLTVGKDLNLEQKKDQEKQLQKVLFDTQNQQLMSYDDTKSTMLELSEHGVKDQKKFNEQLVQVARARLVTQSDPVKIAHIQGVVSENKVDVAPKKLQAIIARTKSSGEFDIDQFSDSLSSQLNVGKAYGYKNENGIKDLLTMNSLAQKIMPEEAGGNIKDLIINMHTGDFKEKVKESGLLKTAKAKNLDDYYKSSKKDGLSDISALIKLFEDTAKNTKEYKAKESEYNNTQDVSQKEKLKSELEAILQEKQLDNITKVYGDLESNDAQLMVSFVSNDSFKQQRKSLEDNNIEKEFDINHENIFNKESSQHIPSENYQKNQDNLLYNSTQNIFSEVEKKINDLILADSALMKAITALTLVVGAISMTGTGGYILDKVKKGGGKLKRGASRAKQVVTDKAKETGRNILQTAENNPQKIMKGAKVVGGVATVSLGAYSAYQTFTDDTLTKDQKTKNYITQGSSTIGALAGAEGGAALGATIGSIVPGVGTLIGGILGGIIGGAAGAMSGEWAGDKIGTAVVGEDKLIDNESSLPDLPTQQTDLSNNKEIDYQSQLQALEQQNSFLKDSNNKLDSIFNVLNNNLPTYVANSPLVHKVEKQGQRTGAVTATA